jgi:hypothetical protein
MATPTNEKMTMILSIGFPAFGFVTIPCKRSHRHFHHDSMSKLTCMMRRSLEIRAQSDLLPRQQLQNFPTSCGSGPLVREHAINGNILPGEKSV